MNCAFFCLTSVNISKHHQAMIDRNHMRAARSLLSWSQIDLARAAGLGASTIMSIEQGRNITESAGKKILEAFARAGVEVTEGGVAWKRE